MHRVAAGHVLKSIDSSGYYVYLGRGPPEEMKVYNEKCLLPSMTWDSRQRPGISMLNEQVALVPSSDQRMNVSIPPPLAAASVGSDSEDDVGSDVRLEDALLSLPEEEAELLDS